MIVRSFSIFQCQSTFQLRFMQPSYMKMRHISKKSPLYYSNFEDDDDEAVSSKQNQRFWTRSYSFHLSNLLASQSAPLSSASTITPSELLTVVVDTLQMKQQQVPENDKGNEVTSSSKVVIPKCDSGLVIVTMQATIPTTTDAFTCNLIVPIHNAVLQTQHAFLSRNGEYLDSKSASPAALSSADVRIPINPPSSSSPRDISFMVCGFFPRAQHVIQGPNEYERPVDLERLAALDAVLLNSTSTSAQELLSAKMAGTPPARIYRSFVSPRQNRTHLLESVDRAAVRTAAQIENTDRSLDLSGRPSVSSPTAANLTQSAVEGEDQRDGGGKNPVVLVLDNLRSAFNVGSIFRSAETLRKTAFSALDAVRSRHVEEVLSAVKMLKEDGYCIVWSIHGRVMEFADIIAEIPTFGVKNSLNVASALPIVLFEVLRQWES
eukprot:gene28621-37598_t